MRKVRWALVLSLLLAGQAWSEVRIAALGDSLTAGYGLVRDDGLVPQLQGWLRAQGADVTVINAGVSGDTTAGGARRVDWTLSPDVDGLIVALGANDLLRGIDPAVSRANLEKILKAAQSADVPVLLVGFQAPSNFGADYKQSFDAIYPDLSAAFDTLYAQSFFAGMYTKGSTPDELRVYFQSDGLHPTAEGVRLIVEGLGPDVQALIDEAGG